MEKKKKRFNVILRNNCSLTSKLKYVLPGMNFMIYFVNVHRVHVQHKLPVLILSPLWARRIEADL